MLLASQKTIALLGVAGLLLAGCARGYDMHLTNGKIVRTASKPKLDEQGWYNYKDGEGKPDRVNSLRVRTIEPAGNKPADSFQYR